MHELPLIQEVVNNVLVQAEKNSIVEITKIKLLVGRLSGVLSEALEFGFNAIKKGTELENTQLDIVELEPVLYCYSCECTFTSDGFILTCSNCGANNLKIMEGKDLILESFEGKKEGE